MKSFLSCLLGKWSNKSQAQSNPHSFRQVELRWEKRDDWIFASSFNRKDPNPYLEVKKKLVTVSDTEVILEHYGGSYSNWTRLSSCDMILKYDGVKWSGEFEAQVDNSSVYAELHLYGNKLFTKDKSLDPSGNIIWGADRMYRFVRV